MAVFDDHYDDNDVWIAPRDMLRLHLTDESLQKKKPLMMKERK